MKKVTIIHTTLATASTIPSLIEELYPNRFELVNVMDDSLLNEIKAKGSINASIIERFVQYVSIAKNNGSDAILLACSSIGKAADIAREMFDLPILKIDEPMAEQAVKMGDKILVLGTVNSTLKPTLQLIASKRFSPTQQIDCQLIENTFEYYAVDRALHDQKIASVIQANLKQYDAIVLAQASMAGAKQLVDDPKHQILTSLPMGLYQLEII